jgi:hypothetical protein
MPEQFVSSRFLLWDRPLAYPKFDLIDRDTDPGEVFDLSVELDNYDGSVYLKTRHIIEMARSLGMMTKDEADKLRADNAELRRQINKLPVVQEELKSGLDDLVAKFFARLNSVDSVPDGAQSFEPQDNREPEESESASEQPFSF